MMLLTMSSMLINQTSLYILNTVSLHINKCIITHLQEPNVLSTGANSVATADFIGLLQIDSYWY